MNKKDIINNINAIKTNIENVPIEFKEDPEVIDAMVRSWTRFIANDADSLFSMTNNTLNVPQLYYVAKKKCMENLKYNPYFAHNLPEKIKKDPDVIHFLRTKGIILSKAMNWFKRSQNNNLEFGNKTDIPFLDNTLSDREMEWTDPSTWKNKKGTLKDYMREIKGTESHLEYMSPDKYLDLCALGFNTNKEDLIKSRGESIDKEGKRLTDVYKDLWLKGSKPPMVYIEYVDGVFYGQEGIHRAIVAKELGVENIPVLIVNRKK